VVTWFASHKTYPQEADRRGEQGDVTVRFTVEPSGRVTDATVAHGSGSPRLDAAAEAMVRSATLPPFDPTMGQVPITTSMPFHYALED
jgi:protein TonB